jgi:dGTPase
LHLVFRSVKLQQLEYKADFILRRLFDTLCERYLGSNKGLNLLSETDTAALQTATTDAAKARLICDAISRMTDGFATRTYKRLHEPDFGSILDLV